MVNAQGNPITWLDRQRVQQHSLDMRQFIDFREATLPNGMRVIDAHNSSGLTWTLLPDRGMDIWQAAYRGIPLTWVAPGSPYPPDYGRRWLDLFNGGLLTTCGLTHTGPPEEDRDLHGDYTRLRAGDMQRQAGWQGERYTYDLTAAVHESALFGEQLRLVRRWRMHAGEPAIHLRDEITNIGDQPAPFMLLYHINVGYPLVQQGAEFVTPYHEVLPRDDVARPGLDRWHTYDAATPGYAEQVYWHHLKTDPDDPDALAHVLLLNQDPGIGLHVSWDTRQLPYLTQWKNTRQGIYVSGIEPANCIPEGRRAARESGRLVMLQPGETHTADVTIAVVDGADALAARRRQIEAQRERGVPVTGCHLDDYR